HRGLLRQHPDGEDPVPDPSPDAGRRPHHPASLALPPPLRLLAPRLRRLARLGTGLYRDLVGRDIGSVPAADLHQDLDRSLRRVPEACGGDPQASAAIQKLVAAFRKLPPRSRSLWRHSASFRRDPEACGGVPQASAAIQKLVVALRKLPPRPRSLRRRSASFCRDPEACGGVPQASAAIQKLVVALRKLPPRPRSLWWRSASFRRDPEACGGAPQASAAIQKLVAALRKVLADD